ncbi:hypothetical protein [Sphingobium boeckii]|uniref:Uncharacterized protein n=1 Tax=Sphingobium boeckii TaxID=1082345 RepID=A0A7W9AHM0_9SPHN|nr:hypothetical protein [Sphingobium boeckii]MBB5685770.1 hypothetical protein [Sphingobium boeckii]
MAAGPRAHPDRPVEAYQFHALVGWTHNAMPNGIHLRIQSTRSNIALENDQLVSHDLVMTRNQALLLAQYLLDVTGQGIPKPRRPIHALLRRFRRADIAD